MTKAKRLTAKEKMFVNEYLKCLNGAQAARNAKYSEKSIYEISSRLLRKVNIRAEIDRRMAEISMSSTEVLARLSDFARGSHRPFVRVNDDGSVYFDFSNQEAMDQLHLIKAINTKRTRRVQGRGKEAEEWEDEYVRVELNDAVHALELLGKAHRLFVERKEVSGEVTLKSWKDFVSHEEDPDAGADSE